MRLFIAPKKDVAAAISKALGGPTEAQDYTFDLGDDQVTWLSGYLLRLGNPQEYDSRYDSWSLDDLPMVWPISLLPDQRYESHLQAVIDLAHQADELVNAGDPDPEGQRLVDEIIEYAGLDSKPMMRLLINDNNPMGILKASLSMRDNRDYRGLSLSALARSVCDQRYGFNLTRTYTLLARQQGYIGVLSVGRVQTPILGLIVDRDRQIDQFKPETSSLGVIEALVRNKRVKCFYAGLDENNLIEKPLADRVFMDNNTETMIDEKVSIESTQSTEEVAPPPLPHSLLSLQAEMSEIYDYDPGYVHQIAQVLRDNHRAITYHRTDSRYLGRERLKEAPKLIEAISASYPKMAERCNTNLISPAFDSTMVTTQHAIVPTLNVPPPYSLSDAEQQVYDLVVKAYLAQFMGDEVKTTATLTLRVGSHKFTATSRVVKSNGWRDCYGDDYMDESLADESGVECLDENLINEDLSSLTRYDHGTVLAANVLDVKTLAPNHYTMRTLLYDLTRVANYVQDPAIKKLLLEKDVTKQSEAGGIGTPATRDKHIETLFNRGFIEKKAGKIVSTQIGREFYDSLPEFAVKPDMTALWHQKQKQIEYGTLDYQALIAEVDGIIADEVDRAKSKGLTMKVTPMSCPICKTGHLVLRTSKANQQFWGCTEFPSCRTTYSDVKGKPDV